MEKYIVGSCAFFSCYDDFFSKDKDYIELVENPTNFIWRRESHLRGICTFQYKKESPKDMIQRTIDSGSALQIGKFLVPDVAKTIGATVQDILPLEVLLPKLDKKHKYLEIIFNSVKENNSFELTKEQRDEAYKSYLEARRI